MVEFQVYYTRSTLFFCCPYLCVIIIVIIDTENKIYTHLASNVSCVTIKDRAVSIADLTRVVKNDNLGSEICDSRCWLVLGVGGDVSSLDVLD